MDCTDDGKDTCGRFGVTGYPTLKIFKGGELSSDYNGPREASELGRFIFVVVSKDFSVDLPSVTGIMWSWRRF